MVHHGEAALGERRRHLCLAEVALLVPLDGSAVGVSFRDVTRAHRT